MAPLTLGNLHIGFTVLSFLKVCRAFTLGVSGLGSRVMFEAFESKAKVLGQPRFDTRM